MKIILLLLLTTNTQSKPDLIIDFKWGISKQQVIKMVGNKYISQTDTTVTYIYKMYDIRPQLNPTITYYFHKDKLCKVAYKQQDVHFGTVALHNVERILKRKGSYRGEMRWSNWTWKTKKTIIDVFWNAGDHRFSELSIEHKYFSPSG